MATYVGLYYPFIHFNDEGWLKTMALYWDGMRRVVPWGADLHDSDEIKCLIDDGFVRNASPTKSAYTIAPEFRKLVKEHGDTLSRRFGVGRRAEWADDPHTKLNAPNGGHPSLAYVFEGKMDSRLLNDLYGCGLVTSRVGDPRWIGMHPKLAGLYMTSLAEAMAPDLGAHPLTDVAFDHIAASGLTMERLAAALLDQPMLAQARDPREIEEHMAAIALRYAIPSSPEDIPAAKIIEFRRRHAEERDLFQEGIAKLTSDLSYLNDMTDTHEMMRHLQNEYDKTIAPRVERLRSGLKRAGFDTVESAIGTSIAIPSAVAALVTAAGIGLLPALGAVAAITLAAWTIRRKHRKAKEDLLKPSPESYIYHASKTFTPQQLTNKLAVDRKRFTPPAPGF